MHRFRATSPICRRALTALLALLAIALLPSSAIAASPSSSAVQAAAAAGTPVVTPPKKPKKKKVLSCSVSKTHRHCGKSARSCTTTHGVSTCRTQVLSCRLAGRLKRCALTTTRCSGKKGKKRRCLRLSVKHTANLASTVHGGRAIPRLLLRRTPATGSLAGRHASVSSSGRRPVEAVVVLRASASGPQLGLGAALGALLLAAALCLAVAKPWRRPSA